MKCFNCGRSDHINLFTRTIQEDDDYEIDQDCYECDFCGTFCSEILDLFRAAGKDVPHEDSDMGRAVQILQTICDSQNHTIPDYSGTYDGVPIEELRERDPEHEIFEEIENDTSSIFEALEEIENHIGEDDFNLDFDGNEYRIINESDIWEIYRDAIQETVEDCYSDVLNLDKVPSFICVTVDWEQTAKNAFVDGYGHQFSGYDGSEEEAAGYYIFRTN